MAKTKTIHVQNRGKRAFIVKREHIIVGDAMEGVQDRHPHTGNIAAGSTVQMELEAGCNLMASYPRELVPWGPSSESALKAWKLAKKQPTKFDETVKPAEAGQGAFKDEVVSPQQDILDQAEKEDEQEEEEEAPAKSVKTKTSPKPKGKGKGKGK